MKYLIYRSFILLMLLGAVSCTEKLELTPNNSLDTGQALQQPSDFTNAIKGVYSRFRTGTYWGGWYQIVPDVLSDNLILNSEGRNSKQGLHYWNYSGTNTWGGLWTNAYLVAYRANSILENIESLSDGDFKNNIQGEALALRAIAHFDLTRVFAKLPQQAGAGDPGVPYVTSTDVTLQPSRPAVQETYDKIIADLEQAKALINSDNGTGRLDQSSINAYLSRVYLYAGQYDQAATAATAAIGDGGTITTRANFADVWEDKLEQGINFKIRITEADGNAIGTQYSQTGASGVRSEYNVDFSLYQLYQDSDIRKSTYFFVGPFASKEFIHIAKYFGRPSGSLNIVDAKLIRWEEVYLSRAEAFAELGKDVDALADLDAIRAERYENFTSGNETGQALKDAIALERRLELAFEGHRFFDLKRKGLGISRSSFGDESNGGGVSLPGDVLQMPAGDPRFQLPIPQAELNANPNMEQNPGY